MLGQIGSQKHHPCHSSELLALGANHSSSGFLGQMYLQGNYLGIFHLSRLESRD
jgi:hypothetical protein